MKIEVLTFGDRHVCVACDVNTIIMYSKYWMFHDRVKAKRLFYGFASGVIYTVIFMGVGRISVREEGQTFIFPQNLLKYLY